MSRDDANDLAQDVVLDCLTSLRHGRCPFDVVEHTGLVKTMVLRRLLNALRGDDRRACRDAEHMRDLVDSTHAWMQPDLGVEERELEDIVEKTIAALTPMCRRTFIMVREDGASYQRVANVLGISYASVNAHVVNAQRRLRVALIEQDLLSPRRRPQRTDGPALERRAATARAPHSLQQSGHTAEHRNDAAA